MRALTIALCLLATPALADVASVIDGDTIEAHGQRIRLRGIDAPESRQLCRLDGLIAPNGRWAGISIATYRASLGPDSLRDTLRATFVSNREKPLANPS